MIASPRARAVAILAAAVAVVDGRRRVERDGVDAAATTDDRRSRPRRSGAFTDAGRHAVEVRFTSAPVGRRRTPAASATQLCASASTRTPSRLSIVPPTAYRRGGRDHRRRAGAAVSRRRPVDEIEVLANTPDTPRAVPGRLLHRPRHARRRAAGRGLRRHGRFGADDVHYVFYTDVGGDDGDARPSVRRVLRRDDRPVPAADDDSRRRPPPHRRRARRHADHDAATSTVPAGATASVDGRWWIRFPDGADVSLRASSKDGFAYSRVRGRRRRRHAQRARHRASRRRSEWYPDRRPRRLEAEPAPTPR